MDHSSSFAHRSERVLPDPVLKVRDASFNYGKHTVLDNVSLDVYPGEILVLLGPNGAGKSTLIRSISGRLRLKKGHIYIHDKEPIKSSKARRMAGFVPQQLAIYTKLTPRENFVVFGNLMGMQKRFVSSHADKMLELMNLSDKARERTETLSGGMKRRVNIGAALMHDPQLLILDEPTVGVDIQAREGLHKLLQSLKNQGLAILLTTHDMQEAESLADRVAVIVAGKIRDCGWPDELVQNMFGHLQHVNLVFTQHASQPLLPEHIERLNKVGLYQDHLGYSFSGMVNEAEQDIQTLLRDLLIEMPATQEIHVRRPGLDTLLERHIEQAQDIHIS